MKCSVNKYEHDRWRDGSMKMYRAGVTFCGARFKVIAGPEYTFKF